MTIKKFHLYLADLNPRMGTEPGKTRPVVVVQTDLLNTTHPSTLVCPLTTKVVLSELGGSQGTSDVFQQSVECLRVFRNSVSCRCVSRS